MAEILPFARGRVARAPAVRKDAAEIVIFPGVRVEYHDRTPEPKAKLRRRRGRRNSTKDALSA
jgi:hypothetical protein